MNFHEFNILTFFVINSTIGIYTYLHFQFYNKYYEKNSYKDRYVLFAYFLYLLSMVPTILFLGDFYWIYGLISILKLSFISQIDDALILLIFFLVIVNMD